MLTKCGVDVSWVQLVRHKFHYWFVELLNPFQNVQTGSGAPLYCVPGFFFPDCEAEYISPSSDEVKNEWSCTSSLPVLLRDIQRHNIDYWTVLYFEFHNRRGIPGQNQRLTNPWMTSSFVIYCVTSTGKLHLLSKWIGTFSCNKNRSVRFDTVSWNKIFLVSFMDKQFCGTTPRYTGFGCILLCTRSIWRESSPHDNTSPCRFLSIYHCLLNIDLLLLNFDMSSMVYCIK